MTSTGTALPCRDAWLKSCSSYRLDSTTAATWMSIGAVRGQWLWLWAMHWLHWLLWAMHWLQCRLIVSLELHTYVGRSSLSEPFLT